ncbi:hypothetical protein KF707_01210 [Candidatus Obscuribacterales bacterium]|jgi:hypothetical protein|nr:hypothetical protein [Candidatus Obscuribacterales bacterium]MBX3134822.1 hypothetical protein [Candidatus Obscuribacterales bacterium]MBX3149531.1 hypothetical protein [Candidatus Obscuribacterales bacterium]
MWKLLGIAFLMSILALSGFVYGHLVPQHELLQPMTVEQLSAYLLDETSAENVAQITIKNGKRIESVKLNDSREFRIVAPDQFCFDSIIDRASGDYGIECLDTYDCGHF